MPNGSAVALARLRLADPPTLEHAAKTASAAAAANGTPADLPSPIKTAVPTAVEQRIGDMLADAAISVCTGMMDGLAYGHLSPSTRARAGDVFVRMYELQEEVARDGIDFAAVARVEGRRVLIGRLMADDDTMPDGAALDEILSWPLGILADITAKEAEYQRTHVH
jgi:hypothetical protein